MLGDGGAGGWAGNIPLLTEAQSTTLMAFYRKPFDPKVNAKRAAA